MFPKICSVFGINGEELATLQDQGLETRPKKYDAGVDRYQVFHQDIFCSERSSRRHNVCLFGPKVQNLQFLVCLRALLSSVIYTALLSWSLTYFVLSHLR